MRTTGSAVVTSVRGFPTRAMSPSVHTADIATEARGNRVPRMLRKNRKRNVSSTTQTRGGSRIRSLIM
ncbi:MAG: hypothetical protein BWZ01_02852 [Deltaproteobacteria bacterium ADurb.BinA179]|nr:MAG: hypothetical protein BWZ01_02852 [Deltaproteobacteria bacterium ADurb.BinA179]